MSRFFNDHQLALLRNRMGENVPVPPKPKKSLRREESRIQRAVIAWWSAKHKEFGMPECLLFAIPNGLWLGARAGRFAKLEGLRSGVSDLMLAAPRDKYHGLFLEVKTEKGIASDAQMEFIYQAQLQGYFATVRYGYDEVVLAIETYLRGAKFE